MERSKERRGIDMLNGPIWNKLPRFALPVAATAILEQLFNACDVAVVGNFTGSGKTVAVAAVGANSAIISLIINMFIGIALGTTVIIANSVGRGDRDTIFKAVHTSVSVALVGGTAVAVIGQFIAGPLLMSLNVPDDVLPQAMIYLRIYLIGMPVILLYNFEAAIFRSVGETRAPLIALAASGVINILLNIFFVAVLGMTVDGVAIATVISNAVSSAILFRRLRRTGSDIRLDPKRLSIDGNVLRSIFRIGFPAGIQNSVFAISNIVIQSAINSLGTVVIAASTAAYNIEVFTGDILNAFGQACTTFVGQNFGAGKIDRCRKTLALCLAEGIACLAAAIALILLFGRQILSIFNNDPDVVAIGYTRLMLVMLAHSFSLLCNVMSGYMRGFGISLVPALLTTCGVCGIRLAWIRFVFPTSPTFRTIMTVYPISLGVTAILIFTALLICHPSRRQYS